MNYSYETSLQPFKENKAFNKRRQCDEVIAIIKRGANNLLQLHEVTGLPQSTCSARINDLIVDQLAKYEGQTVYQGRLRKKIVLVVKEVVQVRQAELFN